MDDLFVWNGRVADLGRDRRAQGVAGPREATGNEAASEGGMTAMKRIEKSQRFEVPVERGFAFVTDPANWPAFWPGFVRLEEGSRWGAVRDTARLVTRLLGRERVLTMTVTAFEPNRIVRYSSTQPGLPDALHERRFEADGGGFVYRLVVEYEPRRGLAGFQDRFLLPRGIARAFRQTFAALEREL
jgi:hypothetical protein